MLNLCLLWNQFHHLSLQNVYNSFADLDHDKQLTATSRLYFLFFCLAQKKKQNKSQLHLHRPLAASEHHHFFHIYSYKQHLQHRFGGRSLTRPPRIHLHSSPFPCHSYGFAIFKCSKKKKKSIENVIFDEVKQNILLRPTLPQSVFNGCKQVGRLFIWLIFNPLRLPVCPLGPRTHLIGFWPCTHLRIWFNIRTSGDRRRWSCETPPITHNLTSHESFGTLG